jgi:hypothetical protein
MVFRVGQKVVCIEDRPIYGGVWRDDVPVKGNVYTIARIRPGVYGDYVSFDLVELKSRIGYRASRFRPVVERKTSIAVFTAMLNTSKQGQDA